MATSSVDLTTMDVRVDRSGFGPDDFEINAVVTPSGGSASAPIQLLTYDYFDSGEAVVINEFLYRNVDDPDGEFVELFNDSGGAIDLQGWKVEIYDAEFVEASFGAVVASVTIPTGAPVMLADQGFYLIGNSQFQATYSVVPDLLATLATEADSVTVALFDQFGNLVFNASSTDGGGIPTIGGSEFISDGVFFPVDVEFGPDGAFAPAGYRFEADGGGSFELLDWTPQPSSTATPGATNVLGPELVLTITPGSVNEDGGAFAATGTVTRLNADTSGALVLTLSEDDGDDSEISIPATVTILANQTSEDFDIGALVDGVTDGPQTITITASDGGAVFSSGMAQVTVKDVDVVQFTDLVINEIDADQPGTDSAEFIELYNLTGTEQSLDGLVLVLFNGGGTNDPSYREIDLDGQTIPANGFFVIGPAPTVPNVDLDFVTDIGFPATNVIQNGQDAVALFVGDASDFPNATAAADWVAGATLVDAVVYATGEAEDLALLAAFSLSAQIDESANGNSVTESVSRDGDGGGNFVTQLATPGVTNGGGLSITPLITGISLLDPTTVRIIFVGNAGQTYVLKSDPDLQSDFLTTVTPTGGSMMTDGSGDGLVDFSLIPGALYFRIEE